MCAEPIYVMPNFFMHLKHFSRQVEPVLSAKFLEDKACQWHDCSGDMLQIMLVVFDRQSGSRIF